MPPKTRFWGKLLPNGRGDLAVQQKLLLQSFCDILAFSSKIPYHILCSEYSFKKFHRRVLHLKCLRWMWFSSFFSVISVQQRVLLELPQQDHPRDLSLNREKSTEAHFSRGQLYTSLFSCTLQPCFLWAIAAPPKRGGMWRNQLISPARPVPDLLVLGDA